MHPPFRLKFRPPLSGHLNGFARHHAERQSIDDADGTETARSMNPARDFAAGDGILMASAVGAKIVNMDSVLLVPYNGGRVTGYVGGDIYLTKEGRRFIDEGASWLALRQALQNLPDGKMWVLTDSGTVKNNDFSLKLMTGAVREAATLDEATKGIGCNPAVLEETVRQYNHSVHIGRDEAFGKTTTLKALDEPPFYYGEERLNIQTEGGAAIDKQARVLDQSEEPLLGLFAAGETVGNLHGKSRPGGNGVLACVVFGRIAGQEAARLEPLKSLRSSSHSLTKAE